MSGLIARGMWAIALVLGLFVLPDGVRAQTFFEKAENKTLKGNAFSRLRNLSYQQCEQRCLQETRCIAFEHYRGGGLPQRSSNCALFSSIERTTESKSSDVGYKRRSVAGAGGGALQKSSPRVGSSREGTARHWSPPESKGVASPYAAEARRREFARQTDLARRRQDEAQREFESQARRRAPGEAAAPQAPAAAPPPPPVTSVQPRPATRSLRPPSTVAPAPASPPADTVPPGVAPGPSDRFHIVPVFYGTDRNRIKQEKRLGYANDRAKRLEMGRALVSVPLDHKVPNIERPRAWTVPYIGTIQLEKEDPNKHFTVRDIRVLSKAELLAIVKERLAASQTFRAQSIVFIHGYNTSFDDALFRTAQISYDLQFDGAAFTYSWPSGGGLASYIYDRDSAQGAERYLYEFLQMVQNETGSQSINIIAHSMGNQMLLQVLRSLKLRAPQAISRINQIILAAPDVDRDVFEAIAAELTGIAKGITLYAAANDRALEASRFVAGNKPRAGDVPEGGPIIVAGIDTIDITRLSTGYLALHHSGYAEHTDLLTDIGQIIRAGTRPWSQRLKAYREISLPAGKYWRYEN
ncbi:MAG: alpha/beta hydrolase [Hyphomicrobiaceae bacterium]